MALATLQHMLNMCWVSIFPSNTSHIPGTAASAASDWLGARKEIVNAFEKSLMARQLKDMTYKLFRKCFKGQTFTQPHLEHVASCLILFILLDNCSDDSTGYYFYEEYHIVSTCMNNALSPQHFVLHALCSLSFCAELHSFSSLKMKNWYFCRTGKTSQNISKNLSAERKWVLEKGQMKDTLILTNSLCYPHEIAMAWEGRKL